jgi:hypothetical protein
MALKFKRIQEETEREKGGKSEGLLSGVSIRKQGKIPDIGMQASLFEEGDSVRSGSSSTRDSIKDRERRLRSFGDIPGSDSIEGQTIQHPVNRPDSSVQRICIQQHKDNSLCSERDDGRLGRGSDARDNAIVDSEEGLKNDERRAARENNKKPYGEIKPSWIDAVFDDLEGSGYACAAVAFPSAGVGAPHQRQRLFWVAHAESARGCGREEMARPIGEEPGRPGTNLCVDAWPDGYGSGSTIPVGDVCTPSYGIPGRVGRLRAYGNAIVPQAAAIFVMANYK